MSKILGLYEYYTYHVIFAYLSTQLGLNMLLEFGEENNGINTDKFLIMSKKNMSEMEKASKDFVKSKLLLSIERAANRIIDAWDKQMQIYQDKNLIPHINTTQDAET